MTSATTSRAASTFVRRPVRVWSGPAAYAWLANRWPQLYLEDRSATPYQSREWLLGWASQLPASVIPVVLVAEGSAGPAAALALASDLASGTVSPLGSPTAECIRPLGRAADDPAATASLVQRLRGFVRDGQRVTLPDVPSGSALGRHFAAQPDWHMSAAPYAQVSLPVTYPALPPDVRKSHTKRLRKWHTVTKNREVLYRRSRGTAELLTDWDVLVDLHRRRWGQPPADHIRLRSVLAQSGSHACVATLAVDGTPVAAQLILSRRHRAFSLLTAMTSDPEILRGAPGHALLRTVLEDLHGDGFASLDLGRTRTGDGGGQWSYKQAYQPVWTEGVTVTSPPRAGEVRLRPAASCG